MGNTRVVTGWLVGLMLVLCAAALPRAASAATCNGYIELQYVAGPQPALPGDTLRVQMIMFTQQIDDGANPFLTFNRVRFDLDCNADFALGLTCTDDGSVIKYMGNITSSNCFDAGAAAVTFSDNSAVGNFNPNEVVFTPSNPVVIPHDTAAAAGCILEFDVKVAAYSSDSTPDTIEQVGGFKTVAGVPDASCSNGLPSTGGQSVSIQLTPPTPTPTNTPTSTATSTPTNSPAPPTTTPTRTQTGTPTSTRTNTATRTPTSSPTPVICQTGLGGLIPGYCHSNEANDCAAEFCSYAVPPPDTNLLHPSNSLTCKEGDPTCDFGPAGDGVCTFKVSLCFNVTDTRIPCVQTDMVSRVFFSDPYETDPHPGADTANRDALEAALLGLQQGAAISYGRGRSIVFTPPLTQGDICTAPALIKVPLRQTRLGLRRRQIMLRYKIYKNATDRHQIDRDILRLTCTP